MLTNYSSLIVAVGLFLSLGWTSSLANPPRLAISEPTQTITSRGTFTVAGNANGFINVEVWFNGAKIARASPDAAGAFRMSVDTTALPLGAQTLVVHAWDSPPHTPYTWDAETPLSITVATPGDADLTVSAPPSDTKVKGRLTLNGTAVGFANVEVSFRGILLGRATPGPSGTFQIALNTTSIPDGSRKLAVTAWNAPAGQAYTASRHTILDLDIDNGSLNILDYGAVADGTTDNSSAIAAAIAAAQSRGVSVFVPAGRFAYGSVLRLTGVKLFGVGDQSQLLALNWANEALFMYGTGAEVRQLALSGVPAPSRVAPWEATRITLFGASNFVIDHVTISGSAAAGIQTAWGANHGIISNNKISNTLSDSIHMTDSASYLLVENNLVEFSGDDGIAVVSEVSDGGYSHDITAQNNIVQHSLGGRSMSVVGGQHIVYQNNLLEDDPAAACLYLAQEGSWNTYGDQDVTANYNTLVSCGNQAIGHGAVMIVTTGSGQNNGLQLHANDIVQNGLSGVRVFGANTNVILNDNEVSDANPAYDIEDPGISLTRYVSGAVGYQAPPTLPIP